MEKKSDIKKILDNMQDEFVAYSAWSSHCYTFEYMDEYYKQIISFMKENNIPTDKLVSAYETAVAEFNRITESDNLSFLKKDDTKALDDSDYYLLKMLYDTCETLYGMLDS